MKEIVGLTLIVTVFVFATMMTVEYFNVLTHGRWEQRLGRWTWGQSAFCAFLGAMPGCLGGFAAVSFYMHRVVTFGALVATMIATSGDEAFVMMALFPKRAMLLFAILSATGIVGGVITDIILRRRRTADTGHAGQYVASHEDACCVPFSLQEWKGQWLNCTPHRGWLALLLALFVAGVASGMIGHVDAPDTGHEPGLVEHVESDGRHADDARPEPGADSHGWDWVRITLLAAGLIGLAIVTTVPDHFLDEHIWNHLVKVHIWRVFIWTFGSLLATHWLMDRLDMDAIIGAHRLPVLLVACAVGIIPESGPHLIFTTLYANGAIPFSVLLANSIVQDGHAMLPVVSHSRRAFVAIKLIKLCIGLGLGLLGALTGW
jgi:hypothetical protein